MKLKWLIIVFVIIIIGLSFPTFKLAFTGLKLAKISQQTLANINNYGQNFFTDNSPQQQINVTELKKNVDKLSQTLDAFINQSRQSWLANKVIKDLNSQLVVSQDLVFVAQKLLKGKHAYVLLFQNSEELRATGGFLGSYAKVELNDGLLKKIEIQDIYVPDGQFSWFIEAPVGARKYLSGKEGLRLRDANWHPDFPTSAQQILTYLAWGKEEGLDGAIAINLPLVEKILTITGPLYISDYDQTVTDKNFADIARADRDQFFPGSQQKQHFLSTFFNQLVIKLQDLNASQLQTLIKTITASAQHKDLQFFSHDTQLQLIFEKMQIAGQLAQSPDTNSLMMVESNVGINKANQHLDRAVTINLEKTSAQIKVDFTNRNYPPTNIVKNKNKDEANHLTYINYQRLIFPTNFSIVSIDFDNQEIADWDEELITNSKNETFKQIGFLITVPEQSSKKLIVSLAHPTSTNPAKLWIQKQAGLPPTPYNVSYQNQTQSFELTQDTLVEFTP
ncbi:DUF4012 domain-containing protein [Patescibacteria group bacterium]|nr:DUF4012 domain-containing protein [Patescibacteria group bacterium]